MNDEERIAMEIRIHFLEDHILEMDRVMMEQNQTIDYLKKQQKIIKEKMQELSSQVEREPMPENETPPHY